MSFRVAGRILGFLALSAFLMSCGGGGSSTSGPTTSPVSPPAPPPPPPPPLGPNDAQLKAASAFASKSTFGMPYEDIVDIAEMGHEAWLDEQLALEPTSHLEFADELVRRRDAGEFKPADDGILLTITFWRGTWWNRAMTASDQVQQRVAYALSQIFVVSDIDLLRDNPPAITSYMDVLLEGSTGNFRDLLLNVSLHPAMGIYLSHVNNRKADPENNIFPDENFAREVMQLFTIGLFELNDDATHRFDAEGNLIPTYDSEVIREYAKIFTGLSYSGPNAWFGRWRPYFREPMQMFEEHHSQGPKHLLGGMVVPEGQSGMQDIEMAIDSLFNHPNVGPFIGRQLIQRLTTSNPSSAYVERVTDAFNGETTGVRGDMKAVIKAILLDPEVTNPSIPNSFGKMREPVLRLTALARQFNAECEDGLFYNNGYTMNYHGQQHPFNAPSVFNFYSPFHSPAGTLAENNIVAPEFQITTATTVINMVNLIDLGLFHDDRLFSPSEPFKPTNINIDEYVDLADDVDALIDRLDIVMTAGRLDDATRLRIKLGVESIGTEKLDRARHAIYLFAMSPSYVVEG
ncbi:MAG: DUF1800 family protein [Gammaproteobacteria bacterium]|nr:DUF1800 family protein [Gammaproteobacteria bacterium]